MGQKRVKAGTSRAATAERRRLFVEAYCGEHRKNGTKSAIAAGFSPKTAHQQASRLLKDVKVRQAVKKRLGEAFEHAAEKTLLTAEEVLLDLAQALRFDPAELYDESGALLKVKDMPLDVRKHLEGVEIDEVRVGKGEKAGKIITSKVRFAKKSVTREQAMKHFGLFEKDNRQKPPLPPILVSFK